jgi:mono/diheme cytochrome c family protein
MAFAQSPAGDIKNGHRLFDSVGCFECHGYAGQGAASTQAPPIARTALSFDGFVAQHRRPSGVMPPYEAVVLSDRQLADIYAYLQTLPGPVDPKTITLPR